MGLLLLSRGHRKWFAAGRKLSHMGGKWFGWSDIREGSPDILNTLDQKSEKSGRSRCKLLLRFLKQRNKKPLGLTPGRQVREAMNVRTSTSNSHTGYACSPQGHVAPFIFGWLSAKLPSSKTMKTHLFHLLCRSTLVLSTATLHRLRSCVSQLSLSTQNLKSLDVDLMLTFLQRCSPWFTSQVCDDLSAGSIAMAFDFPG